MSQQLSLLTGDDLLTAPRSRKTDHTSSKDAGKKHEPKATAHRRLILAAIRAYPGRTSKELAQYVSIDRVEIARRTSDLERDGLIVGERISGQQIRWRVTQ